MFAAAFVIASGLVLGGAAAKDPHQAEQQRIERQLKIAKSALDPNRFALTKAQRALDAVFDPSLSTSQYVRTCVMYGVLYLAQDDDVRATLWFEKALHKDDGISLVAVLGPAVRGYGPKINQRFADIKSEFQAARPVLPSISTDPPLDGPEQHPRLDDGLAYNPLQEMGNLILEATGAVGALELIVDGRKVGETKELLQAGQVLHLFTGQPPVGTYALQVMLPGRLPSNAFAILVDPKKVTRVRILPPPPPPKVAPPQVVDAPVVDRRPPNVMMMAGYGGAGTAVVATALLAGATLFVGTSPNVPEGDRRTLTVSLGVATGATMLGAALLATVGTLALVLEEPPPAPRPLLPPPAPKVKKRQPQAVAEVTEPGKAPRRINLFWDNRNGTSAP